MIVINRSIFYTAFILQPYVHILLSSPSFFIQWNEIQNAYDYQCSGIKKKHLLCTQFSWVYCAMHNCNRGCIKLTRREAKLFNPTKVYWLRQKMCWKYHCHTCYGKRIYGSRVVWQLHNIREIFFYYYCNDMHLKFRKKVRFFIAFLDRQTKKVLPQRICEEAHNVIKLEEGHLQPLQLWPLVIICLFLYEL